MPTMADDGGATDEADFLALCLPAKTYVGRAFISAHRGSIQEHLLDDREGFVCEYRRGDSPLEPIRHWDGVCALFHDYGKWPGRVIPFESLPGKLRRPPSANTVGNISIQLLEPKPTGGLYAFIERRDLLPWEPGNESHILRRVVPGRSVADSTRRAVGLTVYKRLTRYIRDTEKMSYLCKFGEFGTQHGQFSQSPAPLGKNVTKRELDLLQNILPISPQFAQFCQGEHEPLYHCDAHSPFRTYDGSCNNLKRPSAGKFATPFARLLPSTYAHGVSAPRLHGPHGGPLPNPRWLSLAMSDASNHPHSHVSSAFVYWGQFIDHDLTLTPQEKIDDKHTTCCSLGPLGRHRDCWPIIRPRNDPVYYLKGRNCMEFVRSLPAARRNCRFGPREQINDVSAYMDASHVYGSTAERSSVLRLYRGGFMRVSHSAAASYLKSAVMPAARDDDECEADRQNPSLHCFIAGDERANEQPVLTAFQTLFLRERNRIVTKLAHLIPAASDEALFQAARHMIAAMMQSITYNEFLPVLFGVDLYTSPSQGIEVLNSHNAHRLQRLGAYDKHGYHRLYNPHMSPAATTEFATAGFRFAHTLIDGMIRRDSRHGAHVNHNLDTMFFAPHRLIFEPEGLKQLPNSQVDAEEFCRNADSVPVANDDDEDDDDGTASTIAYDEL